MEDGDEVLQEHVRLDGRNLVVRLLLHVAVDDLALLVGLEEFVARLGGLQCVVGEVARVTVQDAPVVSIGSERIEPFKFQVLAARLVVVDDVVGTSIAENLRQIVLAAHGMPVAIVHLAAEYRRTLLYLCGLGLQVVIALLDAIEQFLGLALLADEHPHELNPFCLSQRVQLLIAQMRHQRDACLLDGIVAATLRGRDEDDVRIGGKHQFGVKLALHANLHYPALFYALQDVLVEQILRARDTLHHIVGIEHGEVRQLQGRHADGVLDGHAHLRITAGHFHVVGMHQCKVVVPAYIHQADVARVAYAIALGIFHNDGGDTVSRLCVSFLRLGVFPCTST